MCYTGTFIYCPIISTCYPVARDPRTVAGIPMLILLGAMSGLVWWSAYPLWSSAQKTEVLKCSVLWTMEFIAILKLHSTFSIIKLNTFFVISNQNDIDLDILQEKESIILSSILFFVLMWCLDLLNPLKKNFVHK